MRTVIRLFVAIFAVVATSTLAFAWTSEAATNRIYATIIVVDDSSNSAVPSAEVRPCNYYKDSSGQVMYDSCSGCYYDPTFTDESGKAQIWLGGVGDSQGVREVAWVRVSVAGYETYCQPLSMSSEGMTHKVYLHRAGHNRHGDRPSDDDMHRRR